jgi:hypothetical protein
MAAREKFLETEKKNQREEQEDGLNGGKSEVL